jgi:hypothetical protein
MMNRDFPDGNWFKSIYSSKIIRVALVSLYGVSDLSNIMSNYSDEVWFREMMQLMVMVMLMI